MRKHLLLTLMTSLFLTACATNDVVDNRKINTTPKKRTGSINQTVNSPVKVLPSAPVNISSSIPIDGTVIQHKNRSKAGVLAAVGGGLERTNVDEYVEQQVADLQRALQSEIEQGEIRVERRASDNAIRISMTPSSGFDNLSSVIKPGFLATLNKIAPVLKEYGKTLLTVIGHIENMGPDAGNQRLAERRAKSVTDYFVTQNVDPLRLQSYARNEPQTRADSSTERENQPSRRVELWVQPITAL